MNKNEQAFFALVRAGLWEEDVQLLPYGDVDWDEVYRLAQEQSVLGLVAAGLEHVTDVKAPKMVSLQFVGDALVLEEHNKAMNDFIASLVDKMRAAGIYTLLVKGQGVAQCYERPLWRSCGDVDYLLDAENYEKAKEFMTPLASSLDPERGKHLGMTIDSWVVELHGYLFSWLSTRVDNVIQDVQDNTFLRDGVRVWNNNGVDVYLPNPDNDVIFIFTHFMKHFYKGGLGLRQICDWCRLLWTYRASLDLRVLESRIKQMRLMTEWKAFAAFAVDYLGMPIEAMPLYSEEGCWKRKAKRICSFVMAVGNMGHNRDMSYYSSKPYIVRKIISMNQRVSDIISHAFIFPLDSIKSIPKMLFEGVKSAARGE